jgi:hypothetical protein
MERGVLSKTTRMMGAEPGRPNELSPITRIDTARVRPVPSAAGRSFIEPGSPWQNPFVESFGSRVRDEVLSVEAFDSVLVAQTVITDWRTIYVMSQLGHSDAKFTLNVYAHAMRRDEGDKARLRALVNGADWARLGTNTPPTPNSTPPEDVPEYDESPADAGLSADGRGRARTADLSRVKHGVRGGVEPESTCK